MSSAVAQTVTVQRLKNMAVLPCRHCGGQIKSDARRSQCPHCGALFPFGCAVSGRNMRPPLSVFDDERHLTFSKQEVAQNHLLLSDAAAKVITDQPLPLSDEHHLRLCPEDERWFLASENPGSFLCPTCLQKRLNRAFVPEESDDFEVESTPAPTPLQPQAAPRAGVGLGPNLYVLLAAASSFIGLIGWFLMGRG